MSSRIFDQPYLCHEPLRADIITILPWLAALSANSTSYIGIRNMIDININNEYQI